jgi:outer membrane receptor protein involved in Fe transport
MVAAWLALVAVVSSGSGLVGQVRTSQNVPVAGAILVVQQGQRVFTATTNDRGEFTLPEVELPVSIEVRAAGFATLREHVATSPAALTVIPALIRESILVQGNASEESWRRETTGTTVLPASTLATIPAVTLDEALKSVPGFSLFRRSTSRASNPTTHGITMRGLSASGASRGLVLLDGVPLTDGFGSWVTWTRLPALALDSVEIDRGAQGSTFGSDALGGVLTLSSSFPKTPSATVRAIGGDLGIAAVDASAGSTRGDASMFGSMSWFSTDGVIPTAPESAGLVDVPADAEWLSALGKTRFGTAVDQVTLSGWASWDDRGNGTPLQRNRMSGGTLAMSYDRLLSGTTLGTKFSFSPNSFEQTFTTVSANRQTETLTSTQFVNTAATRLVAEAGRVLPRGFMTARYGLTRTGADFTERRLTSSVRQLLADNSDAVSFHAGWSVTSAVSVGVGVRREWRAAPREGDDRDSATVGNVTGSWRLSSHVVVRGAASSSHRWPTLNEMVRNFQVGAILTRANAGLLPERAVSGEGALVFSGDKWQASAGGFWTVVDDAIANVTIQSTPTIIRERRNAGEAHARGLELDFDMHPISMLTLRASALVVDSKFRESLEPALEGKWLPQVPKYSVAVSGDARINGWAQASFSWRGVSTQFDDDRNVFQLAEAKQLDLRLRLGSPTIACDLTLENSADARIEVGRTPLVTLAPGRTFRIGATWRIR